RRLASGAALACARCASRRLACPRLACSGVLAGGRVPCCARLARGGLPCAPGRARATARRPAWPRAAVVALALTQELLRDTDRRGNRDADRGAGDHLLRGGQALVARLIVVLH